MLSEHDKLMKQLTVVWESNYLAKIGYMSHGEMEGYMRTLTGRIMSIDSNSITVVRPLGELVTLDIDDVNSVVLVDKKKKIIVPEEMEAGA